MATNEFAIFGSKSEEQLVRDLPVTGGWIQTSNNFVHYFIYLSLSSVNAERQDKKLLLNLSTWPFALGVAGVFNTWHIFKCYNIVLTVCLYNKQFYQKLSSLVHQRLICAKSLTAVVGPILWTHFVTACTIILRTILSFKFDEWN